MTIPDACATQIDRLLHLIPPIHVFLSPTTATFLQMKVKLKQHPQDLVHKLSLLVEARKIKEPKFLKAMKLYPPVAPTTRNVDPKEIGMFMPKNLAEYTFKSYEIKYDEDEIRDLFYKQHPFEVRRPIEFESSEDTVWDSIYGSPTQLLKGENVIQRTLFLLKDMDPSSAYKQALKEFYKERESEEKLLNIKLCQDFLKKEQEFLASIEQ